jgi:diketogulonate reductase-like aldo/keto reductase
MTQRVFTRRRALQAAAALSVGGLMSNDSPSRAATLSAATLIRRPIPKTKEQIPAVGLGTWQAFDVAGDAAERARARDALKALVDGGGAVVDSSPMYGSAEAVVGDVAAELGVHMQLFVATKVWTSGRDAGIRQMEASMKKMRVDRKGLLDLMQVHNLIDVDTHLATLRAWKRERRIRYLGITHYTASAHDALAHALAAGDIDFVQINYSLAEPQAEARLLGVARDTGTAVIINRPFAEGAMFSKVKGRVLPAMATELGCKSWAQFFLKWILGHPAVTCAIPGTRNPAHVADNLGAATGALPDASLRKRIKEAYDAV